MKFLYLRTFIFWPYLVPRPNLGLAPHGFWYGPQGKLIAYDAYLTYVQLLVCLSNCTSKIQNKVKPSVRDPSRGVILREKTTA